MSRGIGSIDVFVRGTDDALYQISWNSSSGWGTFIGLGGVLTGGPSAVAWDASRVDVFVRAGGGNVAQRGWSATGGWGSWLDVGGALAAGTGPAVGSRQPGTIELAVTGTNRELNMKSFNSSTGWSGWNSKGGVLSGGPGIAVQKGQSAPMDLMGITSGGTVGQVSFNGSSWSGWTDLQGQVPADTAPAPIWWNDGTKSRLDVFVTGIDGNVAERTWSSGSGWGGWIQPFASPPPAPTAFIKNATCSPLTLQAGSAVGVAVPRPTRVMPAGPERTAFLGAMACLQQMTGTTPTIRTQIAIDVARVPSEMDELTSFVALLQQYGAKGIVSIKPNRIGACPATIKNVDYPATEKASLSAGQALAPCAYPSVALYGTLFAEVNSAFRNSALGTAGSDSRLTYTAWNEPDHGDFILTPALGTNSAVVRAGQYWQSASGIVGASRMLAGEFASNAANAGGLGNLRTQFRSGTTTPPTKWALHSYSDLNDGDNHVENYFQSLPGVAEVWHTEVDPQLAVNGVSQAPLAGNGANQFSRGQDLRGRLLTKTTRVMLYGLIPPAPNSADNWDSMLADRAGFARPFICGVGAITNWQSACAGSPSPFGGSPSSWQG